MHDAFGSNYLSPVNLTYALVSQTNAQHGNPRPKMTNKIVADPSFIRRSRSRRNADFFGVQLLNLIDGCPVIPADHQFRAEFAKILNQVVGERVVVIQYQDHNICSARSIAQKVAMALLTLSSYSSSGTESATTPPPACT